MWISKIYFFWFLNKSQVLSSLPALEDPEATCVNVILSVLTASVSSQVSSLFQSNCLQNFCLKLSDAIIS